MLFTEQLYQTALAAALDLLEREDAPAPMVVRSGLDALERLLARYMVEVEAFGLLAQDMRPLTTEDEDAIVHGAHTLVCWATGHEDTWLDEEAPPAICVAAHAAWKAAGFTLVPRRKTQHHEEYEARYNKSERMFVSA